MVQSKSHSKDSSYVQPENFAYLSNFSRKIKLYAQELVNAKIRGYILLKKTRRWLWKTG